MFRAMNKINGSDVINCVWLEELGKIEKPIKKTQRSDICLEMCMKREIKIWIPTQYCKAIIFQIKISKLKKEDLEVEDSRQRE